MLSVNQSIKGYIKDANGKYRLVDKPEPQEQKQALTLEQLDTRLKRVEAVIFAGTQKK